MDPNIMKFLEEDEDETMHSGADVEAFTAELNRDIEGNNLTQEQSSDSNAVMPPLNHHTTGMAMTSQQAMTSGMSTMTSTSQLKLNKQVRFGMLLPIIQPQLDKDRAMQLHTLYFKLKKNEISKDGFVRHMRSIVGDQMLKMAVYKLQKTRLSQLSTRMASLIALGGPGNSSKASPKKPLIGQKKPMEAPGSSPPSSKKQKVSGSFVDQSIEHLNDVTAVSGVNLREEEEQLFSGSKEDSRVSEASQRVVQEEEERLILQKIPLQKKMVEIMAKSGLKNMSKDVQRCLSLCVEERMRGLISNVIRLSKQRVDIEKPRHKTIITSDVRQQIMAINRKAREEWEKKQAETEKSQKVNEPESGNGTDADKDKDDGRGKSTKVNKEEDDKMRTTAANVAVRAATGVGDIISRWQLMIEAKQKQGGSDTSSAPQTTNKDVGRKPPLTTSTRENQETEKQDSSFALTTPAASVRKVGRNQVVVPRVARCISVKDVISVLEREPQMSKSTLLYHLY